MAIVHRADWRVCAFQTGKVCDVMSSGCLTTKNGVARLVYEGWKKCVFVRCRHGTGKSRESGDWLLEK